jgi:hypothetical protein
MPKGATSVARRERTASKGPVGRRKTGVSCDTVAILVKRCIFSALARHLFWHSKKAPFFDPQGRPKERVLLGSGSKIDNLDAVFSFVKIWYFCVFFDEPWWGKIGLSHHSVGKNHEFSWGRNLAPTRVTWVRQGGGSTGTSFERGCSDCSCAGGGTPPFQHKRRVPGRGIKGKNGQQRTGREKKNKGFV